MPENGGVPFVDLRAQFAEIADDLSARVAQVFAEGAFVGGAAVDTFEKAYAAFSEVEHCVGVANGTDAIELALRALDVGKDDEVVVPANSFIASAEAVSRVGAVPVFADVDADTLLIDPAAVEGALTSRSRVILAVHLFGQMADVEALRALGESHGCEVVEDAAQSQGARAGGTRSGAAGRIAATSFYPGKNLGAAGDAGAVTTDDLELARRVRMTANHGSSVKYEHEVVGVNSRLDALQAVVLTEKLRRLTEWNARRVEVAAAYVEALREVPGVVLPTVKEGNEPVWHLFVIQVPDRDRLGRDLAAVGIGSGVHYPTPLHLTPAYAERGACVGAHPVAERAARRIISLPMHPHLTDGDVARVVEAVRLSVGRSP